MQELKNILVAYQSGERGLPTYHELAAIVESTPSCGACPGDGSICKTSCRVAYESPPIDAIDIKADLRDRRKYGMNSHGYDMRLHVKAADHIEALEDRIALLESEAAQYSLALRNAEISLTDAVQSAILEAGNHLARVMAEHPYCDHVQAALEAAAQVCDTWPDSAPRYVAKSIRAIDPQSIIDGMSK